MMFDLNDVDAQIVNPDLEENGMFGIIRHMEEGFSEGNRVGIYVEFPDGENGYFHLSDLEVYP